MGNGTTWRESLSEYTDIDLLQHDLARMLGIVTSDVEVNDVKALYWTKNPIGDALAAFVLALGRAGVLEQHPEDQTLLRWNPNFRGCRKEPDGD
jgi:hypothetical protein